MNRWLLAGAAFALLVLLAIASLLAHFSAGFDFETSLLALLPGDAKRPLVDEAIKRMADSGSKRVVLLVSHNALDVAGRAADAAASALKGRAGIAHVISSIEGDFASQARDFYYPWRYRLLSAAQRERLTHEPDKAILDKTLENLYSPMGPPRLAPLEADPLGLFSEGLLEAAARSAFRIQDGRLTVQEGARAWVVVLVDLSDASASMADQKALLEVFDEASAAAKQSGAGEILRAGFVFHAAEAARQAQREMSVIGLGSTLGILLLIFLAFRSFKPLLLVLLPIVIGCASAIGLSLMIFQKLHVLTLVFGSSIIGVAVDYGVLFVAGCAGPLHWNASRRRKEILRPVSMAIATSLLAYATLAALPFPILRQMGVFTMLGLISAWLTAMLWLPLIAKSLPDASQSSASHGLLWVKARWPRVGKNKIFTLVLVALAAFSALGISRLKSNDDVRQLYASAPETVRQQEKVQQLMRLPAAGQFFLVTAPDEQALLRREESLCFDLQKAGVRYQAVSQFVPSLQTQASDQALQFSRIYAPRALASRLFGRLESPEVSRLARHLALKKCSELLPDAWLASPLSTPFRPLWMGKQGPAWASIVTITEAPPAGLLKGREGVEYVDHLKDLSSLLGGFRERIGWILLIGYAVVSLFLLAVYRGEAWRILLPTMLASLIVAGTFGWLGLNYNLFCVFGILMSLDMGVDYGIFMQDKNSGDFTVALLSSSLAACSTLLSFGLLALSHTPALQIFGLSVLLGIGGSWLLAPCFSKGEQNGQA